MKLECKGYGGPYLPKDVSHNKTIHVDQRIRQVLFTHYLPINFTPNRLMTNFMEDSS